MRYQALGTVAIWLAGGAVLAGDWPAAGTSDRAVPPPADFPPPALGILPPLPTMPAAPPQALPPLAADMLQQYQTRRATATTELVPYTKDSPYFAIGRLVSWESRPTAPQPPLPLQKLPGIAGLPPDTAPRDLRALPEAGTYTQGVTPYYGMAVPGPAPAATGAPVVLHEANTMPVDEGYGTRLFGSIDYLLFWTRRSPTPDLVQTVSPDAARTALSTGDLPPGAATTLFGSDGIDQGRFSGVRGQVGLWLNQCGTFGVDASYLHLFEQSTGFAVRSDGVPVIGRDYFDVGEGRDAFLFYSTPDGVERGFININAATEMYTLDANLRVKASSIFSDRLDITSGLRYLNLRESLSIDSGADFFTPAGVYTQTITSQESFRTKNQFYGSQMGVESHYYYGNWALDFSGKLAMGWVHQEAEITGGSQVALPGQPVQNLPNSSILYVQPTNAGSYSRNIFGVLPEFLVKLGYQITPHVRAMVGYDVLYLNNVIRPGSALDAGVNPSNTEFIAVRTPSTAHRPAFSFDGTDFWAQGVTFGLMVTY